MKMRFWALSLCAGLLASTSVGAACNGGYSFTAGGVTFCHSNVAMNWWSAFNWCQANGQVLTHIAKVCPGIQEWPNANVGACSFLNNSSGINVFMWTSMAYGDEQAIAVQAHPRWNDKDSPDRGKALAFNRNTKLRALCVSNNNF